MKLRVILPSCTEIIGHVIITDIEPSKEVKRARPGRRVYLKRYDPKYEVI